VYVRIIDTMSITPSTTHDGVPPPTLLVTQDASASPTLTSADSKDSAAVPTAEPKPAPKSGKPGGPKKSTANSNVIGASSMFVRSTPIQVFPNLRQLEPILETIADKYVYEFKQPERAGFILNMKRAFFYNLDIALVKSWQARRSRAPFDNRDPLTIPYAAAYMVAALQDHKEKQQPDIYVSATWVREQFPEYFGMEELPEMRFQNEWRSQVARAVRNLPNKANSWVQIATGVDSLLLSGVLRVDVDASPCYYTVSRNLLSRTEELFAGALRLRPFTESFTECYLPTVTRDEQPALAYMVTALRSARAYSLRDFDNEILESFYRRA
jgi:hypothetical protein